jgi:hypothetical protein
MHKQGYRFFWNKENRGPLGKTRLFPYLPLSFLVYLDGKKESCLQ